MKKKVLFSILATLLISTATACGTDQTASVSTDTTLTISESVVSEDVAVSDNATDETVPEDEGTSTVRTVSDIDLAFEVTSDTDVYEYVYIDGVREYIKEDEGLLTGTLVHAYGETSDGYYQIEYGTNNGYILKDSEGLSETDIGYILSDVTKNYEMLFDYTLYNGPSIHYGKSDIQLSKGDTVEIIGIAENGWLKTKDGFISFNGFAKEIVPKDTTVATTTEAPACDTTTTNTTTSDTVTAAATTTTTTTVATVTNTGTVTTEVQARDKVNAFMQAYPEGTPWGWGSSYTAYNGKTYWACDGLAYWLSDYIFGNAPYTSIPVNINTIRVGDILTTTTNNGHRCVCIGIDPVNACIITADGNYPANDGQDIIHYGLIYEPSEITSVVTRYANTSWSRLNQQVTDVKIGYCEMGYPLLTRGKMYLINYADGSIAETAGPAGDIYYNSYIAEHPVEPWVPEYEEEWGTAETLDDKFTLGEGGDPANADRVD